MPIAYDKKRINIEACNVDATEQSYIEASDFELTDEQAEIAHAHVMKQFDDFVLKDEEKYAYLMQRYFEIGVDFPEEEA